MNDPRTPLKTSLLLGPLLAGVLALHAWGDGASDQLGTRMDLWRYPERAVAPYRLRVPRRSGAEEWAAAVLKHFPGEAIQNHGALLELRPPAPTVEVVLLDSETASKRLAGDGAGSLKENESLYDPARRTIVVRMGPAIDQPQVSAALKRGLARMLLYDAGSSRWSPWLAEGLIGLLEGSKAADLKAPAEELPPLDLLLAAREAEFRGLPGAAYSRAARLLTAYLVDTAPEEFAAYYRASRLEGPARLSHSIDRFANPLREQSAWRDWIQGQK